MITAAAYNLPKWQPTIQNWPHSWPLSNDEIVQVAAELSVHDAIVAGAIYATAVLNVPALRYFISGGNLEYKL